MLCDEILYVFLANLDISLFCLTHEFRQVFGIIETQTTLVYVHRNFFQKIGTASRKKIYD